MVGVDKWVSVMDIIAGLSFGRMDRQVGRMDGQAEMNRMCITSVGGWDGVMEEWVFRWVGQMDG